ncbi:MAG: hypoxanthine phosphoribosyltransferase [Ignavibacteria bacterium]|nr:hypoxanthine phosphoribosyltransferase [Bacteroidota bacterium]MSQ46284.1 hypoxanthine phosphoribosyltransferase [Ignavibacteria bacterium]
MTKNKSKKDIVVLNKNTFELYLDEKKIQKRVLQLANKINREFKGKEPIFICVLNGAFMFFSDLIRQITIDCEVDFLKLSSYGDSKISSGKVTLLKDLNCEVRNRNIVMVEDIVDTGLSMKYMRNLVMQQNPKSFTIATLLLKPDSIKYDIDVDYVGFKIPNKFVVGYGLDFAQKARNLRAIYQLKTNGKI